MNQSKFLFCSNDFLFLIYVGYMSRLITGFYFWKLFQRILTQFFPENLLLKGKIYLPWYIICSTFRRVMMKQENSRSFLNTIHNALILSILSGKKICCTHFSIRVATWLILTFFMFTQSIKFYTYYYHILYRYLKNLVHQIDSKNQWLLLSARFAGEFGFVFPLTLENTFS